MYVDAGTPAGAGEMFGGFHRQLGVSVSVSVCDNDEVPRQGQTGAAALFKVGLARAHTTANNQEHTADQHNSPTPTNLSPPPPLTP